MSECDDRCPICGEFIDFCVCDDPLDQGEEDEDQLEAWEEA